MKKKGNLPGYISSSLSILCLLCSGLVWPVFGQSQSKMEKERRIEIGEVPDRAVRFVDSLFPGNQVKWYFEENLIGNSIEGKLRNGKQRYSVEFDTSGVLQDIEKVISAKEVRNGLFQQIRTKLDDNFRKVRIDKIQVQFSGDPLSLLKAPLEPGVEHEGIMERYEIVFRGKKEDWKLYEATFSKAGDLLSLEEIILKNTDHLAF